MHAFVKIKNYTLKRVNIILYKYLSKFDFKNTSVLQYHNTYKREITESNLQ